MSTPQKMFVLVRNDLGETYRHVQGCHALAEYAIRGNREQFSKWDNHTLIHLGVPNQWALQKWAYKLKDKGKDFTEFHEPDLDGELTAIACIDGTGTFSNLPLA